MHYQRRFPDGTNNQETRSLLDYVYKRVARPHPAARRHRYKMNKLHYHGQRKLASARSSINEQFKIMCACSILGATFEQYTWKNDKFESFTLILIG